MDVFDVAVVGGGVAGLQAALTLGRACRRVVLFDDAQQRNRTAVAVRGFVAVAPASPADVLAVSHSMLDEYDVTRVRTRVSGVEGETDGFTVVAGTSSYRVRTVVLATGLVDQLPAVPGLTELWGRGVVACPHCHGWEVRDRPLAQLTHRDNPSGGVDRALLLSRWSRQVTFFSDDARLTGNDRGRLQAAAVRIVSARVLAVRELTAEALVVDTSAGVSTPFGAVFVTVRQRQQSELASALGCRLAVDGPGADAVWVDRLGRTSVPGVYAAGSTVMASLLAVGAAGHASTVATTVHADLLEAELCARS